MVTADATLTPQQRMADVILQAKDTTLRDFLTAQRSGGATYEETAQELYALTDRAVSISYQTVKRWLIDLEILEVAS